KRDLANRTWKCHGQLAAGVCVAEKDVRNGRSAHRSGMPGFQYRWRIFCNPIDGEWPSVFEYHYVRFFSGMYRLNEIQLPPRQVNVGTRRCLAANVARFAYDQDREIRIFCRVGSLIKVLIAIADKFAAFLVPDLRFADLLFDP